MLSPDYLLSNVFEVNVDFAERKNIKAIIFDIDNTLVGFTVSKPSEDIKSYINGLKDNGIKIAIASNNNKERVSAFCEELGVEYISRACKPLPFAILRLCKSMNVEPRYTALVGDQIYTDMICANLCGMTSVMVDIIDKKETLLFKIKRALEKPVINAKRRKDEKKNG